MAIEHDYFGLIEEESSGALYWSETVDLGDQAVSVELTAVDERRVNTVALDAAAAMIQALEGFDDRARDALVAELSERASVAADYVDRHVSDLGDTLLDLLVHNSGDIPLDVLRSLQLVRVVVSPEQDDEEEPFAVFDYSLSPDDTDYLLVVTFDIRGDVTTIEMAD